MSGGRFSCRSRRCGGRRSAAPPSRYCQTSQMPRITIGGTKYAFFILKLHELSLQALNSASVNNVADDMLLEPVLTGAFVHHSRILNMPTLWRNDELKFLCGKCTWSKAGKVDDGSACECTLQDPIMERSSEQNRERYPFMLLDGSKGILPMSYERSGGQYLQSFTGSLDPGLLLSSSTGLISQSLYGHHSGPGLYSCVSAAPAAETVTIASDYRRALSLLLPQQSVLLPQDVTTQCNQRMLEQVTSEDDDPTIIGQVPEALHPEYLNFSSEKLFLNTSQSRSWTPTFGLTADVLDSIVKQHF